MIFRHFFIAFIILFGTTIFFENADAGCDVEEVIFLVKKKYDSDKIRQKCRNKVDDVDDCSLSKVIRLARRGLDKKEIYKECTQTE